MAFQPLRQACQFNAASGGTGGFVVASAFSTFLTPENDSVKNGNTYYYFAQSLDGTQWELGSGPYNTATHTQARTTIQWTSAENNSVLNFLTPPVVAIQPSEATGLEIPPKNTSYNLYTSSQTITIPLGSTSCVIRMVGSSGGTSGIVSAVICCVSQPSVTAPSGAGAALKKSLTGLTPGNTLVFTLGAAGTAGTSAPTAGGNAGTTTLASGTQTISTLTCPGGHGSSGGSLTATSAATGGDINWTPFSTTSQVALLSGTQTSVLNAAASPDGWGIGGPTNTGGNSVGVKGTGFGAATSNTYISSGSLAGVAGILGALEIWWLP